MRPQPCCASVESDIVSTVRLERKLVVAMPMTPNESTMGLMMTPPPMPHSGPSVEARKQTMAMMSRLSMLCPVA